MCRGASTGSSPSRPRASATKAGFSEQDQTDLYTRANAGRSQGRVGLGTSSQRKVAGARWTGTKTKLGDSESEDGDSDLAAEPGSSESESPALVDVLPGGATISWFNGVRPSWFLAHQAGASTSDAQRAAQARARGDESGACEPALSKAGVKAAKKAAKRTVRKHGGTCEAAAVVHAIVEAIAGLEGAPRKPKALKACARRWLASRPEWQVKGGLVAPSPV